VFRSRSITSEAESVASEQTTGKEDRERETPLTPASSMFPPPSIDKPSSRRSSFSGSNAPGSPVPYSRYGRSPSPMPPLPAIRTPLPSASPGGVAWHAGMGVKLYGDESYTNFFRRLAFSPDGGLLMTPAGQFEDPSVVVGKSTNGKEDVGGTPVRGRRGRPSVSALESTPSGSAAGPAASLSSSSSSTSSVYIYSRANFARPPIAQLPGHRKASVAVKFSPILYELRPGVEGPAALTLDGSSVEPTYTHLAKPAAAAGLEKGKEGALEVDVLGPPTSGGLSSILPPQPPHRHQNHSSMSSIMGIIAPTPRSGMSSVMASPMLSPLELRPPTPVTSKPPTPLQIPQGQGQHAGMQTPTRGGGSGQGAGTGSVFALGYRMLFAVVTMDSVAIYDTQQAGPVCLLTKLHYDEFTDVTW